MLHDCHGLDSLKFFTICITEFYLKLIVWFCPSRAVHLFAESANSKVVFGASQKKI